MIEMPDLEISVPLVEGKEEDDLYEKIKEEIIAEAIRRTGGQNPALLIQTQINKKVIECLRALDEFEDFSMPVSVVQDQDEVKALPNPKQNPDLNTTLKGLAEACVSKRMTLESFTKETKTAYLKEVFKNTEITSEASEIMGVNRTYATRLFTQIGLRRRK